MFIYHGIRNYINNQHGVVARFQLIKDGYSRSSIQRAVSNGYIERVCSGIYVIGRDERNWKQKAAIGVLRHGPNAILSHESVLVYLEILSETSNVRDESYQFYLPRPVNVVCNLGHKHFPGVIKHSTQYLDKNEVVYPSSGIPYISIETSFIFGAKNLYESDIDFALEKAISKEMIDLRLLRRRMKRYASTRSLCTRKLMAVLEHYPLNSTIKNTANKSVESVLEKRVQRVLDSIDNVSFVPQYRVSVAGRNYRLDFADPVAKVAVEVDGFQYHRNRSRFDDDRERQNLLSMQGWKFIRVTSSMSNAHIVQVVAAHFA